MFFKLNLKISSIGLVLEYLNAPGPVRQKTDRSVILTDRYVRVCFTLGAYSGDVLAAGESKASDNIPEVEKAGVAKAEDQVSFGG